MMIRIPSLGKKVMCLGSLPCAPRQPLLLDRW
jgi:hypothetical protein